MDDSEATALTYIDRIACMTDAEVRAAYLSTDGEAGDAWTDALAQACQDRNIDI